MTTANDANAYGLEEFDALAMPVPADESTGRSARERICLEQQKRIRAMDSLLEQKIRQSGVGECYAELANIEAIRNLCCDPTCEDPTTKPIARAMFQDPFEDNMETTEEALIRRFNLLRALYALLLFTGMGKVSSLTRLVGETPVAQSALALSPAVVAMRAGLLRSRYQHWLREYLDLAALVHVGGCASSDIGYDMGQASMHASAIAVVLDAEVITAARGEVLADMRERMAEECFKDFLNHIGWDK